MPKITGGGGFERKLRKLTGPEMAERVNTVLYKAGKDIADDMALSIMEGSASGTKTKKHLHVPSRPGEPPNNETGDLVRGIEAINVEPLHVVVSSNAPHSIPLEFGTSKMAERPFARPAAERARKTLSGQVAAAVNKILQS